MIGIIIQARTGSTRLPKKMILPFFNEVGLLETMLIRLKKGVPDIPIILATTSNKNDDILEEIAKRNQIIVFRGSEMNVLERFIIAAKKNKLNKIIRICADNPFLDIAALKHQIDSFKKIETDYWTYSKSDNTPTIKTHYGFWTEGVTLRSLERVDKFTNEKLFQEHVTNYIYTHPDKFKIHFEKIDAEIENETEIRLTIDTAKDFEIAKKIYLELKINEIPCEAKQVVKYIKSKPEWLAIMKNEISTNTK